jgi:hypothetical protein
MIYGQVRGGASWTEGFKVTGTKDPALILKAAVDFFKRHPLSLFIGIVKSYRDFFFPGDAGIFSFDSKTISGIGLWVIGLIFLIWGLVKAFWKRNNGIFLLLLSCFIGLFFSIPLLPPVDGGNRFYASTMAFFLVLIVIPLIESHRDGGTWGIDFDQSVYPALILGSVIVAWTVITPISLQQLNEIGDLPKIECPSNQESFVIELNPDSYLDLIKGERESCGIVPEICLSDFQEHGTHVEDDFYLKLVSLAVSRDEDTRVIPTNNLIDKRFHFFVGGISQFDLGKADPLIAGCATQIQTESQSIYYIERLVDLLHK